MTNNVHFHILQDNQNVYDMIINNLPIGFSVVDSKGLIVDFNRAAEKITGYDKSEVIGKSHLKILHGSDDKNACPLLSKTLQEHREAIATENTILKKSGEYITKSVTTFPLFDDNGNIIGGVEIFRDISEFKRMERERKNILSMYAHDMKGPVVKAGGFLASLISGKIGKITDRQQDCLKVIGDQLNILDDTIKHFLELSNLDTASHISRNSSGARLGLSIVKTIVEMHGGKIRVESSFGKENTFTFTLPKNQGMKKNA